VSLTASVPGFAAGRARAAEQPGGSAATFVEDGIDTFVFRDGLVRVQTVRYTGQRKG